jgi:septal ring factor EnvC (AmiA/AmiB activator)
VINGSVINGTAINANVTNRQPQQATPSAALPVVANIDPGTDVQKVAAVIPIPLPLPPGGLFAKGIRLSAPVKGKVLQHFGKVKVTDFSDMIFSKGLEYAVAAGSSVYSVYPGKVAYVGMMPGYETVVVLEHGERSYSLYGRLGKSVVKIGDAISKDQAVGIVSDVDQKGRNFYFEVRKSGTPVDPKTVLTKTTR